MGQISEMRALLIDGQRHLRQVLVPVLRETGLREVFVADGVMDGVMALPVRGPDVIFVDYDAAPAEALDFVRYVRIPGRGWNHQVPVILMAHAPERAVIEAARDEGVNDILIKPLTTATIVDRLRRVLISPRPFVDDPTFRGPDRRRRRPDPDAPQRRREDLIKAQG
jgi:CheY-like chemotaxis protein